MNPKWLIGRTITDVQMNTVREPDPPGYRTMHSPVITLDNGAQLRFFVEEHPDGAW